MAESCRLRMAFRAVVETRLIRERRIVQPNVTRVALMGTAWFRPVLPSHADHGSPSSRAKLQIWRALTAVYARLPDMSTNTTAVVRMFPARLPSLKAVRKTHMKA